MHLFDILREDLRRRFKKHRTHAFDQDAEMTLRRVAEKRRVSEDDVLIGLVYEADIRDERAEYALYCWRILSEREKEATALICRGLTNRQMAVVMRVAESTVKTYVERAMAKFQIHNRKEIRDLLAGIDLTSFE